MTKGLLFLMRRVARNQKHGEGVLRGMSGIDVASDKTRRSAAVGFPLMVRL